MKGKAYIILSHGYVAGSLWCSEVSEKYLLQQLVSLLFSGALEADCFPHSQLSTSILSPDAFTHRLCLLRLICRHLQGVTDRQGRASCLYPPAVSEFLVCGLLSKLLRVKLGPKCFAVTSQASQALKSITHAFSPLLPSESLSLVAAFTVAMSGFWQQFLHWGNSSHCSQEVKDGSLGVVSS